MPTNDEDQSSIVDSCIYNPWKSKCSQHFDTNTPSSAYCTGVFQSYRRHSTHSSARNSSFASQSTPMPNRPIQRRGGQKRALATQAVPPRPKKRPSTNRSADYRDRESSRQDPNDTHVRSPPRLNYVHANVRGSQPTTDRRRESTDADYIQPITSPTRSQREQERNYGPRVSDEPTIATDTPPLTVDKLHDMLKASEARVVQHVVSQQRILLGRITAIEDLIKDVPTSLSSIQTGLTDLKMMSLPVLRGSASSRTQARQRNQTKTGTLQMQVFMANPTLPTELKLIFETDVACIAAAKAIASQMVKFHRDHDAATVTARAMNIFLYSLRKDMPKSTFKEGIGYRHAEFRFKISKILLEVAKTLPEHVFTLDETSYTRGLQQGEFTRVNRMPSWLSSGAVDSSAMSLARKHHECIKSELPPDPSSPEKQKALVIAKSIMKVVIDMLRISRDKSRVRMFDDGLCCLVDWESLEWFPDDLSNPKLDFMFPEAEGVSASTIPENTIGDVNEVREANIDLLQNFISERREMLVEATYNVHVTRTIIAEGRRRKGVTEKKTVRRVINILRIAKSFLCAFCHISEELLFSTHISMLQCLYRFSLVIRGLFASRMNETRAHSPVNALIEAPNEDNDGGATNTGDRDERNENAAHKSGRASAQQSSTGHHEQQNPARRVRQRLEIPPIKLRGLIPAASDRDRILQNTVNLTFEAYKGVHTAGTESRRAFEDIPDRRADNFVSDGANDASDSDDDDLSDMLI